MANNPDPRHEKDDFLEKINHADSKYLGLVAKSTSYISSGDVLRFSYRGQLVNVLVVSTKIWSKNGIFLSSRNNILLSCYKLDDVGEDESDTASSAILKKILTALYNNRGIAQYKYALAVIGDVVGEDNFKTYNLSMTGRITKITLDKNQLSLDSSEVKELEDIKKDRKKITKKRNKLLEGLRKLEKYIEFRG